MKVRRVYSPAAPGEKVSCLHAQRCVCVRCTTAAALPAHEAEEKLSALAGAAVWFADNQAPVNGEKYEPRAGLCLRGAVKELARLCGFRAERRCYFTGPKILWLLSQKVPS